MRRLLQIMLVGFLIAGFSCPLQSAERNWKASGNKGLVVSGTSAGTAAGIEILSKGGNAADAAAASILALSVSAIGAFCIGGEAPVLVYDVGEQTRQGAGGTREARLSMPRPFVGTSKTAFLEIVFALPRFPLSSISSLTLLKIYGTLDSLTLSSPHCICSIQAGPVGTLTLPTDARSRRDETGRLIWPELCESWSRRRRRLWQPGRKVAGCRGSFLPG